MSKRCYLGTLTLPVVGWFGAYLETITEPTKMVRSVGLTFSPVQLELCIVLRGKWLIDMGCKEGQKLTVYAEHNLLQIMTVPPTDDE